MKKICFVIPRAYYLFNPEAKKKEDKVGGAQKQTYLLSTELAKDSIFNVSFCMADFGQPRFEVLENVILWNAFSFKDNIVKRTLKLFRTLKKINADTYIFRSPDIGVAVAIFYLKFFLRKKALYMIAGDMEVANQRLRKYTGSLTAASMNYVYKKADTITAQTKQQADQFHAARKRHPDSVIKNIYDPFHLHLNPLEKMNILWVGRLDKIKNPMLYLKLAQKYPDKNFIMIAPIVRDNRVFGAQIQEAAGKIKNLNLIEYVEPQQMNDFYLKSKIYVLTSEYEGFSNTMAEAMQAQCAVLTYNVNPDNLLNEFNCGRCANADENSFFSSFEQLISDSELTQMLGKNAAEYISKYHGKEDIINTFKKMIV